MNCNKQTLEQVKRAALIFAKGTAKKIFVVERSCKFNFYEEQFLKKTDSIKCVFDYSTKEEPSENDL